MNQCRFAPTHPSRYVQRSILLAVFGLTVGQAAYADDNDQIKIGAGVAVTPRFIGSDEYRVQPVPIIDYRKGRFFARTGDGVGLDIIRTPDFTVGAGVNWMKGYRSKDVPDGIGGLSDALGAKLFISTHLAGTVLLVSATQAITQRDRGLLATARVSYPYPVTERLKIVPSVAVNWASAKYMNSYFGVNADQSTVSGLGQYSPSAGFRDASVRLAVRYDLNKQWSVMSAVGASRLLGDAADSPLIKRKSQFQGMVGIAYTF